MAHLYHLLYLFVFLKFAEGSLDLQIFRRHSLPRKDFSCHEQLAEPVTSVREIRYIENTETPGNCSCVVSFSKDQTFIQSVDVARYEGSITDNPKSIHNYSITNITALYFNYGYRNLNELILNDIAVPMSNSFITINMTREGDPAYPILQCSASTTFEYEQSTTTATSLPFPTNTHVARLSSTEVDEVLETTPTNAVLFSVVGAAGFILLMILVLVIVCIVKKRSNTSTKLKKTAQTPDSENIHHSNGGVITEHANVPNDNQEFGVEYAEINMNLLAPKPEKPTKDNGNETAPLVYADLTFLDNTEPSRVSPNAEATHLPPAEDNESNVQLNEDDIAALYAKPVKKNKQ